MYNHIIIHLCCQYSVHNKIWGTLNTIESSANVHVLNYFAPLMSIGYVKKIEIMIMFYENV